ncbi:MAG: glucose-6-phosphate dehydrogenase [Nitrospinota bacterium]
MAEIKPRTNMQGGFCTVNKSGPCAVVIFGASGDLAHRKLIPSLFSLFQKGLLSGNFYILGCARSPMTDETFQIKVRNTLKKNSPDVPHPKQEEFSQRCTYLSGDYNDINLYTLLSERLTRLDARYSTKGNHLFYLATPPNIYCPIIHHLGSTGLSKESEDGSPFVRVVIEKPLGRDLESVMALDRELHRVLREHQIYRIDHYLGKETVQNILMFRFANAVFEPIWTRQYIDHIQITVAETLGVEHRASYYEQAGLMRDMFQNHMLQMLALVAMEAPASFDADRVRDEKIKLLRTIRPFPLDDLSHWIVRGQYRKGPVEGVEVPGYRYEPGVVSNSMVETFVAARIMIDNWRWQGVPFYLRSGKRMARRISEIAITFKNVPHSMFAPLSPGELAPNVLVLHVQPEEGISLSIQVKKPGPKVCLASLAMDLNYREIFGSELPKAYERLLLDCMLGDQTLFWRHDGVEVAWSLVTPVLQTWQTEPETCPLTYYPSGTWGPAESDDLLDSDSHQWRIP